MNVFQHINHKKITRLSFIGLALITTVIACRKDPVEGPDHPASGGWGVSNEFSSRVHYVNRPAQMEAWGGGKGNGDHYWEYVAQVDAPVFQGEQLSATHIVIRDDKAYVSYNRQGDLHLGGVEIIDLSNKAYPTIHDQMLFDDADVNAVEAERNASSQNRKLWLACSDRDKGAIVRQITLSGGDFTTESEHVNLSNLLGTGSISASANGVAEAGNYLYVTAGKTNGGSFCLNANDLSGVHTESFSDAKYVAVNNQGSGNDVITLITGDNAVLKRQVVGGMNNATTLPINPIVHQNVVNTHRGKSTLHFAANDNGRIYVASATNGLRAYDINSGQQELTSPTSMLNAGNCNSVTSDDDYLYMANGADGLGIALLPEPSDGGEIDMVFTWDMEEQPASANYITSEGEWVFIAKGHGGFIILRKIENDEIPSIAGHNNQGVPNGLEPDIQVCSQLLPNIYSNVLPEGQNAPVNKPAYFQNTVKHLYLNQPAEVNITFVDEGAGYKNVLGYYWYDANNPPNDPNDLTNQYVIFPNCSAVGSGGGLVKGNTMKLLGNFDGNTVIGFFLIANGWKNQKITEGLYTHYTENLWNINNKQQSLIFRDTTCQSTVIAFEDITVPNGDNDFNDAIFQISTNPASAVDVSAFIQI